MVVKMADMTVDSLVASKVVMKAAAWELWRVVPWVDSMVVSRGEKLVVSWAVKTVVLWVAWKGASMAAYSVVY